MIEESDSYGFRHIGKFPLNSFDFSYGLEYSDENYLFSTFDEYGGNNQSIISQQTQNRKNYNYFLQLDKSFKNSFLTIGIGSNNTDPVGAALTVQYSSSSPGRLYYGLTKGGYISTADTEVSNYSEIRFIDSEYNGEYKISTVSYTHLTLPTKA